MINIFSDFRNKKILVSLILILFAIWSFPSSLYAATGGLDPSWVIGVHMAKIQNLIWGKDIIFTYGPLGYLLYPININNTLWSQAFVYTVISDVLFFVVLFLFIVRTRSPLRNSIIYGIFSVIFLNFEHNYFPVLSILLGFYLYLEHSKKNLMLLPLSFSAAFFMYVKYDIGIGSLSVLVLSCIFLLSKKRWKEVILCISSYTIFVILIWLFIVHSINNFGNYIYSALMITSGYTAALSIDAIPVIAILVAITGWLFYVYWILDSVKKQRNDFKIMFLAAGVLFIFFKIGFVRADGHVMYYFFLWAFIFLIFLGIERNVSINKFLKYCAICFVIIFIIAGIVSYNYEGGNLKQIFNKAENSLSSVYLKPSITNIPYELNLYTNSIMFENYISEQKDQIKKYFIISKNTLDVLGNHTIDIMPWDNAVPYAYDLNWHPRPVLQSLNVYNNDLDNLDAEFFKKFDSPDFILYKIAAIDDRYPLYDEPAALQVILCKYQPIGSAGDFLLLQKNENICYDQRTISEQEVNFGQKVQVPIENDGYLFAKIYVEQNILGKISYILYKPPEVVFQINDEDTKYRLIPKTAIDGIVMSSAPNLKNRLSIVQKDIHSIRIMSNLDYYFEPKIKIEFVEIKAKTSSMINQKTAFIYNNPFDLLNEVYVVRPDLQQVFPEVEKDDFNRLVEWAKLSGIKEYQKINNSGPMFDLLYIYYARQDLQDAFPEVKTQHNLDNLLKWVLEHGIKEDPTLKTEKDFFLSYKT